MTQTRSPAGAILRRLLAISGLWLWAAAAQAGTVSYAGTFVRDDEQWRLDFRLAAAQPVSLQTWSFGGGINGAGTGIAAGGFAPALSLFDASDMLIGLAEAGVADCGGGSTDPTTGFCWDSHLSTTLPAGDYRVVLTQDDNLPLGPFYSDGFLRDGQPDFTGQTYLGASAKFVLLDGSQRTGDWALDLTTAGSGAAPEPGSLALLSLALAAVYRSRTRRI